MRETDDGGLKAGLSPPQTGRRRPLPTLTRAVEYTRLRLSIYMHLSNSRFLAIRKRLVAFRADMVA